MNVLLVSPEYAETFWSFKHILKLLRKSATLPPLGLLTVAAMLPATWTKRLRDLNVSPLRDEDLAWADLVMVSAMVVQRDSARRVLARCRAAGVRTVAGGPLFTCEPEAFPEVDHLVLGEAEVTLPPFLADLAAGTARPRYDPDGRPELGETPTPLWEIADLDRYASLSLQYSRGCPFDCEFCNVTSMFGHRPRLKTAGQILSELDRIDSLGWRGRVFFVDDNFIGNKRRLLSELLPALAEWRRSRPGFAFYTEASINLADDEQLMARMVEAGFDTVFVGIETPSEEGLAECSKKQNARRDLVADVKRIQRAGLQVQGGFIVGFDSDDASIFDRQIELIQRSGIVTAMVGMLQAPAGTRLEQRMARENRLLGPMRGEHLGGSTNIVTRMRPELLREGHLRILRHIYRPGPFYRRVRTFLREYQPPRVHSPMRSEDFRTVLRAGIRLGVIGRERFQYWMLIGWTALRRPRLMPLAITLAISGHHFRKVCERVAGG